MNALATGGLKPDLTLLLDLDPDAAHARAGEEDRFEAEGAELQRAVARAYSEMADADPGRWRRIDAARSPDEVHADVLAAVRARPRGGARVSPLAGTEDHAHARVSLESALASGPSHAYLFHGPAGVGKGAVARAFAAELLAEGAADPDDARRRVEAGVHPDLTWVTPTGAHEMRLEDVDEPVIAAATRTPFESQRRVFVLERADTMSDRVANRLLKTLEEPAPFVHLILITDALGQVLPDRGVALPARALRPAARRSGSRRSWRARA